MARITFTGVEYGLKLTAAEVDLEPIAKKALYEGAKILADKAKTNLQMAMVDKSRTAMISAFGITPARKDKYGDWNLRIGFDGYQALNYGAGKVPYMLLARVKENGATIRSKAGRDGVRKAWERKPQRFMRTAYNATKETVRETMAKVIEEEMAKEMSKEE